MTMENPLVTKVATPSPYVIRYGMYPNESYAGHAEARVLPDGCIHYTLFFEPFDGEERTLVIDPANPEHMRSLIQLHLQPELH